MIVQEFMIRHPQASFDMMTPGGYVFLTPEKAKELLAGKDVAGHPSVSESARVVTTDELLNQEVVSANYSDNVWHILSDFPQMEQETSPPEQGGEAMLKLLKSKRGEGYIDVCVLVLCAVLVIALAVRVLPVFIAKNQLDTYATELCREAEISGRVGSETSRRAAVLTEQTGLSPRISWSKTGSIQLNEEITVTLTLDMNIGLFGGFGSFPVTLRSEASGKSEVYHK